MHGSVVEYDHLISLELGGSNDATNLWPEPIAEAHIKDRLDSKTAAGLCRSVCTQIAIDLDETPTPAKFR